MHISTCAGTLLMPWRFVKPLMTLVSFSQW